MTTSVPFLKPSFPTPEEVAEDYAAIVAQGTFSNGGPQEQALAREMAAWIGPDVRVSLTTSGTAGLQLAGAACFLPGRPLVLVPSFTFAAGPLAVRWCGYEPLFFDIEAHTWQPDFAAAEAVLRQKAEQVGGILLTSTFGVTDGAIDTWEAMADDFGVPLVIDAAAGFGATYEWGERAGGRGTCEVFSLHATKTMAIGEGGAVASADSSVITHVDRLKNFGFDADRRSVELGTNAKLPEMSCAIGRRQLAVLERRLGQRRAVLDAYIAELSPLGATFQPGARRAAPAFVSASLPSSSVRDAVAVALERAGIASRTYYNPPVHLQPFFVGAPRVGALPVTTDLASRIISLPMADDLDPDVVARIGAVVREVLRGG